MQQEELLKKKILYKSANRGLKENDILLGNFVKSKINILTSEELIMLDNFLDEPDIEIFGQLAKKDFYKTKQDNRILEMILDFYKQVPKF